MTDTRMRELARAKVRIAITWRKRNRHGFDATFPTYYDNHGWHYDTVNVPSVKEARSLLKVRLRMLERADFTIKVGRKPKVERAPQPKRQPRTEIYSV